MKALEKFGNFKISIIVLISSLAFNCYADEEVPFYNSGCDDFTPNDNTLDPASPRISSKTVDLRELPCFWFSMKNTDTLYDETRISQKFAKSSFIYAIAAYEAYEKPLKDSENIPFPSLNGLNEEILKREIENTGFYAKSWVRKTASGNIELIISYRGTTDESEDWTRGNLFITNLFFIDNQFDDAIQFAKDSVDKAKINFSFDEIVFTGHSLGGGLAQYAQRYFKGSRAVVFDPSPNRGRIYSIFDFDLNPVNALRIYEKGEVLEYPRKLIDFDAGYDKDPMASGKKTRWMSFNAGGIIGQHSIQDLALNLIKVAASIDDKEAIDIIKQLESRRTIVEMSNSYYELNNPYNTHRRKLRNLSLSEK